MVDVDLWNRMSSNISTKDAVKMFYLGSKRGGK